MGPNAAAQHCVHPMNDRRYEIPSINTLLACQKELAALVGEVCTAAPPGAAAEPTRTPLQVIAGAPEPGQPPRCRE